MTLFGNFENPLNANIGNNHTNAPDDIIKTKRHLNKLGYFTEDTDVPFITKEMERGIIRYQKDKKLRIDGVMKPGGETERSIFEELTKTPADMLWDYKEDDSIGIGFGGDITGTLPPRKVPKIREGVFTFMPQQKPNQPPPPTQTERVIGSIEAITAAINAAKGNTKHSRENRGVFKTAEILARVHEETKRRKEMDMMSFVEQDKKVADSNSSATQKAIQDAAKKANDPDKQEGVDKRSTEYKKSYKEKIKELDFDPYGKGMKTIVFTSPIDASKAKSAADDAIKETAKKFPEDIKNRGDNEVDAYRHALWSIKLVRSLGHDKAKEITDAYERNTPKQTKESQIMDLENNKIARELALDPENKDKSDEEIANEALEKGLLVIKPEQTGAPVRFNPLEGRSGITETQNRYNRK